MTRYQFIAEIEVPESATRWFREEPVNYILSNEIDSNSVRAINRISGLPDWDDLTDIDKGAVVWFLSACESEGDDYATKNYPAEFIDNEALKELDSDHQCAYILDRWEDIDDLGISWDESNRLHDLYDDER